LLATNLLAAGFFVLLEIAFEDGADAIFLDFSLLFAACSVAAGFLGTAGSIAFCWDELKEADADLLLANPVFVLGFLAARTLDFAGFATTFVEMLALVDLTIFAGFDGLLTAVFETETFVLESDDFTSVALAPAKAATLPLETLEAGTAGFLLAVLLLFGFEGFCEVFGLFFDALNGNSIIGWTT
jgi:hypothetical protein